MTLLHRRGRFLPTPSARRATTVALSHGGQLVKFLPTPSARRATGAQIPGQPDRSISTHALREEGDAEPGTAGPANRNFYPRPPRGGRLAGLWTGRRDAGFLPTPSARRATPERLLRHRVGQISTHALREEGDIGSGEVYTIYREFLPTPSARRATTTTGETYRVTSISTHALREEGDVLLRMSLAIPIKFLPTPSARRATQHVQRPSDYSPISTHALREEGDRQRWGKDHSGQTFLPTPSARRATAADRRRGDAVQNFYPRPPRGGRPENRSQLSRFNRFLPTPSARRATNVKVSGDAWVYISTHALREEGDVGKMHTNGITYEISTHALREEGDKSGAHRPCFFAISTHALREEGDSSDLPSWPFFSDFYPRPPRGGRRWMYGSTTSTSAFLPTPSARRATADNSNRMGVSLISTHALREEGDACKMLLYRVKLISTHALREDGDGTDRR